MNKNLKTVGTIVLVVLIPLFLKSLFAYFSSPKWIEYTSKEGRFKIEFPKSPSEKIDTLKSDYYGPLFIHLAMYDASNANDDNVTYIIGYVDYPDSLIHSNDKKWIYDFFDTTTAIKVNTIKGKLNNAIRDSINNYPGQKINISLFDGEGVYNEKDFFVKNRVYEMSVVTYTKHNFNKSIDHFLNTFKLL